MAKHSMTGGILAALLLLGAHHQADAQELPGWAAGLDPTGLSQSVRDLGRDARSPEADSDNDEMGEWDLSQFAPSLTAIAAGHTERPNIMGSLEGQMDEIMALQALSLASSIADAALGAALSGGAGLMNSAPHLAMQAASSGQVAGRMAAAKGQTRAAIAKAEAERAADRIVPDADRPAEAQAILSVLQGSGRGSAAWENPATGASGRITVQAMRKKGASPMTCRLVRQEWRQGKSKRTGTMPVCQSGGEWYDLS